MSDFESQEKFYLGLKGTTLIVLPFLFLIILMTIAVFLLPNDLSVVVTLPGIIVLFAHIIFDAFSVCLEINEDYFTLSYWGQRQSMKYSEIEKLDFAYERATGFDAIQVFSYSGTKIFIHSSYFDQFWKIVQLLITNASKHNVISIDQKILKKIQS